MVKRNTKPVRIDPELDTLLKEIQEKNDMSIRQASREVAKIVKKMRADKEEVRREIKF